MSHTTIINALCATACVYVGYLAVRCIHSVWLIYERRKRVNQLPGLPLTPILGNVPQIPTPLDQRFFKFIRENVEKYPYVFHLQVNPTHANCMVVHPKTIKAILKTTEPKNSQLGGPYRILFPWLGNGLLISTGQQWFRNRRLLTPAFHFDILKPYMTVFNEATDILLDKWTEHVESKKSFDLYNDISLCTLNVIMRCAFSTEEDMQRLGHSHPYVDAVFRLAKLGSNQVFEPWKHFTLLYRWTDEYKEFHKLCQYVHDVADDIIAKRREHLKNCSDDVLSSKKKKLDFLDILLSARDEDGSGLSDLEIRNEVDTFLFEGHDTTASGISWILFALAKHQGILREAQAEVDELFAGRDTQAMQWEDLNKMPYLTRCIKEGMRLYSPVSNIARLLTKPLTLEGVELLPGTSIAINLYGLHHNPTVWGEDHMQYKPDRFLPDNISNMDSYAFCPFSAGPRNCIGQNFAMYEEKTIIARIIHRYNLTLDPQYADTEPMPQVVTRPTKGIHVCLTPRHGHTREK